MDARFLEAFALVDAAGATTAARCVTATALPGGGGSGVYTVTLDRGLDAAEMLPVIVPGTAGGIGRITNTSDTIKTITFIDDAGAALDTSFYAGFWRVAWGGH